MNKKKITIIIVVILLLITGIIAFSYAYWRLTYTQTGVNKLISSCFSLELSGEKNSITLDGAYPISDEKGKELTPYSFTITNTCDLFVSYTINLEMLEGTTLESKYIKTMLNNESITNLSTLDTTDTSVEGAIESRILFKGSLGSGDSTDYTLRVWMDSDTPPTEETMNKIFQGKITVAAEVSTYSPVENGFTNLAEALLVNEYQTTNVDVAKNKIASKQEVDFSKTAPIIDWQEKHSTTKGNYTIVKADSDLSGQYGITDTAIKAILGTSYTFDSSTGYYSLVDTAYYDISSVDFEEKDYYFCASGIRISTDSKVSGYNNLSCASLLKINSFISVDDSEMTLPNDETINTKVYTLECYTYKEIELESDKSDKGLYEALDDYGTTYYYRGSVKNNHIKFAGYYWKIIRINGDGSIRLLYSGDSPDANEVIGSSAYHATKTDPTYVGYMYSNTLKTSYADTISNDNDSTIKIKLDNWYKTNILDVGYSSYIADSGFCNDRSFSAGDGFSTSTIYYPKNRMENYSPTYQCTNLENDLFTLNSNTIGNKSLTYPIGLVTIDELMYAGLTHGYLNKMSYLHSSSPYWAMSAMQYIETENASRVALYSSSGTLGYSVISNSYGVKPVINLKADTEITGGIGTANDPFIVE